jgi:hypothetical protein
MNYKIWNHILMMNLKLEGWTSLASLGLSLMFVALLISFYNFLIGPEGTGPERVVEPGSLMLQIIFISATPSLVLAGFAFVMAKSFGSRVVSVMLIAAGLIIVAGMFVGITMLPNIPSQYVVGAVGVTPYIFLPGGAGVSGLGGYLLLISKSRRIHSRDLDDLR